MKLLRCASLLCTQTRGSRNSVVQYRKRRSILKDYRVQRSEVSQNVYAQMASPIDKIVPIDSQKTAITIDILGEETYPKLTEWRRQNLVRRARRVLPLPISLTTDDQVGRIWKQRFLESIHQNQSKHESAKEKLFKQIPDFVKLMMEKDPNLFKNVFPEIYAQFQELTSKLGEIESIDTNQTSDLVPYFPFLSQLKNYESDSKSVKYDEPVEDKLLDEEYMNYLKHHEMLQYFASNLKNIYHREYNPEIEGWTSQIWMR